MYHCKTRIHQRFQWLIIIINHFSCCLLCSSILESNLVSAPWHSVSLHWPVANSWTTDTTKSREQQKSLVLSLLPVAITSPLSLVLLTKILFFFFFLSFLLGTELVTHMLTSCTHKHNETQALRCLLNDFIPPTALPHPHLSSACRSDIVPTWIWSRFSASSVTDINLKNQTLILVSVFLAVFTLV